VECRYDGTGCCLPSPVVLTSTSSNVFPNNGLGIVVAMAQFVRRAAVVAMDDRPPGPTRRHPSGQWAISRLPEADPALRSCMFSASERLFMDEVLGTVALTAVDPIWAPPRG
jgi:hypothetical protein